MELIKARTIQLTWDGDRICALIGTNLQDGISGFGSTAQEALRDLATEIERHVVTVWVPRPATQYREGGVLKSDCPECGHVHEMTTAEPVWMCCRKHSCDKGM